MGLSGQVRASANIIAGRFGQSRIVLHVPPVCPGCIQTLPFDRRA